MKGPRNLKVVPQWVATRTHGMLLPKLPLTKAIEPTMPFPHSRGGDIQNVIAYGVAHPPPAINRKLGSTVFCLTESLAFGFERHINTTANVT